MNIIIIFWQVGISYSSELSNEENEQKRIEHPTSVLL